MPGIEGAIDEVSENSDEDDKSYEPRPYRGLSSDDE